jgi:3D (Asp-Asp-Asp) domain-containing protein
MRSEAPHDRRDRAIRVLQESATSEAEEDALSALSRLLTAALCVAALAAPACRTGRSWDNSLEVTATAYNSVRSQTQGDPTLTAWGIRLEPGMKAIAVSRDLIRRGLTRGVEVKIEGLEGTYVVVDKMNARFTRRIDIYMGKDVAAAREWGRRKVTIYW